MNNELILFIIAYLIGSIPTGLLLGKYAGVDIRKSGSGNIGATNAYRTLGRKIGVITLICDCLKGLIPVLIARFIGFNDTWMALIGLAALIGHIFSIFLAFKGGKGVATALGAFLGISPLAVLCALAIFAIVVWKWRYISLGSIIAAIAMPLLVAFIDKSSETTCITLLMAALVVWRHKDNITRLRRGSETKFKA
ncbi:MAG: glycerol-3-phosphate 1-O-acyltransferase PlsY [Desulfuromonadales bacterium]|nr:glycerol-3-phosphate 1-O-acyltransferase PlsY [Desulfuromonadales bacterium]